MLTAIIVLLVLLIIAGLFGLVMVVIYTWVVSLPLAKTRGRLPLPGLQGLVEVLRDRWGVPHVYASSEADLWRSQGFLHAQDRLWQMELGRRVAHGRLAELFGPQGLDADRLSRTIGFRRAAEAELATLDPETLTVLQHYADGVNGCVTHAMRRLPAEFAIVRATFEPWTPLDSLACAKVTAWSQSGNWESELLRSDLLARLGPERAADLEPEYPADNPLVVPGKNGLQQVAGLLLSQYELSRRWFGAAGQGAAGSNAWAVDGKHSATGKPLLACDPHLAVQMPCAWYENHLEVTGGENALRLSGMSSPGLPGIVIGHNAAIAWGAAAVPVDTQDLYVEQPDPEDARRFRFEAQWDSATVLQEEIVVRGRPANVQHEVVISRHGPILNGILPDADRERYPPLALRWTGHEPGGFVRSLLALNRAASWEDFQTALGHWTAPAQSFVYGDGTGQVACCLAGLVPQRAQGLGLSPAPGWSASHDWLGWIPASDLPQTLDPAGGFVISANNKLVGDDYPHFLTLEWDAGYRARRLSDVLQAKPRHTRRDFEVLQNDLLSLPAQQVVPYFSVLNPESPWERTALRQLVEWNYRADRDSAGAALYELCYVYLLEALFADKLGDAAAGYLGQARSPLFPRTSFEGRAGARLLQVLDRPDLYWYAAGARRRTREELLAEVFGKAVKTMLETVGDNTRRWQWGRLHQVSFSHPLGATRLGWLFSRGPYALDGDGHTVSLAGFPIASPLGFVNVAVSCRQIIDLDDFDRSLAVLNTGQSGQPGSPHYSDQVEPWREGEYHPMLWSREKVEEEVESRLTLAR